MQNKILLSCRAVLLFLLSFSFVFFFTSCGSQKSDSAYIMVKDGLICTINNGEPYTGKVHSVIASQILEYDVVKGIKDGNYNVFSESGKVLVSGLIKNNKNEGMWQYFYPDGELESRGYFNDDKISGKWCWYYPDGKLKRSGYYTEGKKDGKWTEYDEYGKVISEAVFRNDAEVAGMEDSLT